ncbi:tetratricopeptide repeat protein [Terriglobus roseus DSM 18391]|uniref:Tetratricopeptide repeat protein n=1 Tax=Terriglobus roseus (strain DSM 18391 / NRRL B-41598 / KBS 63) TaxID=926566 RepID=I3ZIS3_TERRK|nr:tetratricopeptide repeat protein [Terriglobus roseus]AFL89141.1 tetratricopeptide repeat protein [Terriglobus roseus DSM 18391]
MNQKQRSFAVIRILLVGCAMAANAQPAKTRSNDTATAELRAASAAYDKGDYREASVVLEKIIVKAPRNFEAHEMLGLAYAAQSRTPDALKQLRLAVALNPASALAHANLATSLVHAGQPEAAEPEYKRALELDRTNYDAARHLAGLYLQSGRIDSAIPLLQTAQKLHPDDYDTGYDLALAYLMSGQVVASQRLTETLLRKRPSGDLHNLAGQIAEKQGRFIDAVNEFAAAAHQDPSEENLFAWGTELLAHRTYVAAIEVFRSGAQRYPDSSRILVGLGMSLYARGDFEESVRVLLRGADASPSDARCYLYLSKAYLSAPSQAEAAIEHFRRYAELEPRNGLAQFYYGMSLWKGNRQGTTGVDYPAVEALLQKATTLNDKLADAHLQLGILYTEQREYEKALPQYERALQLDPLSSDAHFRMGRYYLHAGLKDKAENEFDQFKRLQAQNHAAEDKAKADVQQFVVSGSPAGPAQP